MKLSNIITKTRLAVAGLLASGSSALAEGASFTYTTPPGLQDAIDTAKGTASGLAGDVIPAAVVIIFAFAGLVGVWLLWRVFKRGASGR